LLVEAVLELKPAPGRLIDVGTGSGAIAVTLALELGRPVIATDVSSDALAVARENAARLGAEVGFVHADLLAPFADDSVEVVVSNPPYVPLADRETLQREVRDWEPSLALFAGPSGLCVYERLIPEAKRVLKPGGILAVEVGFGQSDAVIELARAWNEVRLIPDLAGIPRVLVCRKP
jgi:release factor glutamine methyltransferase